MPNRPSSRKRLLDGVAVFGESIPEIVVGPSDLLVVRVLSDGCGPQIFE